MNLDERARTATQELLEAAARDPAPGLADLDRRRRRRTTTRLTAAAVAAIVGIVVWVSVAADRHPVPAPEPIGPGVHHNGAIVGRHGASGLIVKVTGELAFVPTDAAEGSRVQFTRDGRQLVYVNRNGFWAVLDVQTGTIGQLTRCVIELCDGELSPDGRRIVYGAQGGLVFEDIRAGVVRQVRVPGITRGFFPAWSPDGMKVAFGSAEGILVARADGSAPRTIHRFADPSDLFLPVAWSPDSSSVAFFETSVIPPPGNEPKGMHDQSFLLSTIEADGSGLRSLAKAGNCYCLGLAPPTLTWSPDGTLIAFSKVGGGVFTMRPDGTGLTRLSTVSAVGGLAWQPVP